MQEEPDEFEQRLLRRYQRGQCSWDEAQVILGNIPDTSLITQTTVEEVEAEHPPTGNGSWYKAWEKMKAQMQPGDELWKFDNGLWDMMAGNKGYKLLRNGRRIASISTFVN